MPSEKTKVLIAGAGLGGLSAAAILARAGLKVDVLERAAALTELGAGIQCSANALHVLAALGLSEALHEAGFAPQFAQLRSAYSDKVLMHTPLGENHRARYGQDYLHLHRADLHRIILAAARQAGASIHLGHEITGTLDDDQGAGVVTSHGEFRADYVIGADGIRSAVRENLNDKSSPRFTGQTAWRALVPTTDNLRKALPPGAVVWMGQGRHLVAYYLRGGSLINIVAVLERQNWAEEGWAIPGDPEKLRAAFSRFHPHARALLEEVESCFYWGLFDRVPVPNWTAGNIAMLGDAAHPMLPFLAQGAAMAIEDAWVLSHHIIARKWLGDYAAIRKKRAGAIARKSRAQAGLYHAGGAGALWRNTKLGIARAIPALQDSQLDPIYGVNVVEAFPINFD